MVGSVVDVANRINLISKELSRECAKSETLIDADATADSEYDKSVAIKVLALKANGNQATLIPALAKGDASDEKYTMLVAKGRLKAHWEKIKALEAQMNAQQSIFSKLSHT